MEIIIGKTAGFCYGVTNAVSKTKKLVENSNNEIIYCLGELVHNRQVVEALKQNGLKVVETPEEMISQAKANSQVVIRAHGISPKVKQLLQDNSYRIMDFTCPNVLAIHQIAETYEKQDYYILITGKKEHPEVIGIVGCCENSVAVIEEQDQIIEAIHSFKNSGKNKILLISQTTFSLEKFQKIAEEVERIVKEQGKDLVIKNTICPATKQRQEETAKLAKQVDYMIIIGGKNSSNTKKLYDIAKEHCKNTISIETAEDIDLQQFRGVQTVGIMAGASTPRTSIEEVEAKLRGINTLE